MSAPPDAKQEHRAAHAADPPRRHTETEKASRDLAYGFWAALWDTVIGLVARLVARLLCAVAKLFSW